MRVSDAEREAAAAELREHFASGRLTQDEMDERLTAVFAAKTRADLNAVFTDLPSSGHGWTSASAPGSGTYGSFGPGAQGWDPGASDANSDWQGHGNAWRASAGRSIGRMVTTSLFFLVLLGVGILGIFHQGRPFGFVLVLAALAVLRRLVFMIFGRRRMRGGRGGRGGGPRRRRR
jgi:hypothetical protein